MTAINAGRLFRITLLIFMKFQWVTLIGAPNVGEVWKKLPLLDFRPISLCPRKRQSPRMPHPLLAITSAYVNRFRQFLEKCHRESKQSKDALLSHLIQLVLLHYLAKSEIWKLRRLALLDFNHSMIDLFQSCWVSIHIVTLLCDLHLALGGFQHRDVDGL